MEKVERDGFLSGMLLVLLLLFSCVYTYCEMTLDTPQLAPRSYVPDPQGEWEVGQVVVDPIPLPVSASGLLLSRVGVKAVRGRGWVEYHEALVSSVNPPRVGRWVRCLTYHERTSGPLIMTSPMTSVCDVALEEH